MDVERTTNRQFEKFSNGSHRVLLITGAVGLLVLLAVGLLSYFGASAFVGTSQWLAAKRHNLQKLRAVEGQVEAADSDELRRIATGSKRFDTAMDRDYKMIKQAISEIKVPDSAKLDGEEQDALDRIVSLIDAKTEFMQQQIESSSGGSAMKNSDWVMKSDDMLWQIRGAFDHLFAIENERLAARSEIAQFQAERVTRAVSIGTILSVGMLLVTLWRLNQELSRRIVAEATAREMNAQLETRVKQRTADLELAFDELERFSYSVAHDLRTPVRAVGSYLDMFCADYGQSLNEDAVNLLKTARGESKRMGQLIDDLLKFSRVSRQSLTLSKVAMEDIARAEFQQLAAANPERRIEFQIAHLPTTTGDPALLRQVWHNLLCNALKFTRKRQVARIEVGSVKQPGETMYFVKDNGAGFDMRYASKLYAPFQRLHDAAEYEGTGIGLALVERIIHRHHGKVWGEGKPGEGATFYFALPEGSQA